MPPVLGKESSLKSKYRLLIVIALLFIATSAFLFILRYTGSESHRVFDAEDLKAMPGTGGAYRSINNWATVEVTSFKGVNVSTILKRSGAGGGARVRVVAPDGYFWPEVGTWMTPAELDRASPDGLYPIIAYEIDGKALDPEPEGTGPLRYVAPQYAEDEVNKPSWVSNVRLIEVGPLEKGVKAPDAKKVPVDQVWVYGNVPTGYPVSLVFPVLAAVIGLVVLAMALVGIRVDRNKGSSKSNGVVVALILFLSFGSAGVTALRFTAPVCLAQQGPSVFSMSELTAMPAFSGHYTFLKQLPPYTYYEQDYTGVALSSLLREKMSLSPGANQVVVRARDGYTATLTIQQVDAVYPGSLKAIIAYSKGGQPLAGDEGPLRLIVPQNKPGNHDQGSDPNTPLCGRMICAVEVLPLPAGTSAPDPGSIPAGSLAVYGAVSAVAATPPATPPAPAAPAAQPPATPAPAQATPSTPQPSAAANPVNDLVNSRYGGPDGLAFGLAGRGLSLVCPWPVGFVAGSVCYLRGLSQ